MAMTILRISLGQGRPLAMHAVVRVSWSQWEGVCNRFETRRLHRSFWCCWRKDTRVETFPLMNLWFSVFLLYGRGREGIRARELVEGMRTIEWYRVAVLPLFGKMMFIIVVRNGAVGRWGGEAVGRWAVQRSYVPAHVKGTCTIETKTKISQDKGKYLARKVIFQF